MDQLGLNRATAQRNFRSAKGMSILFAVSTIARQVSAPIARCACISTSSGIKNFLRPSICRASAGIFILPVAHNDRLIFQDALRIHQHDININESGYPKRGVKDSRRRNFLFSRRLGRKLCDCVYDRRDDKRSR